ncbi:hypothetical protein N0V88_000279 [Collariella sp. IMI 366227]|nr:hypothetical protein N0V88_000279 [Collariella sp. IMI 366227]
MAPQKGGSVRHKGGKPTAALLTPFRDDSNLVALRYEQTKQAEPPIPLPPPRNPRRISTNSPRAPIVVVPPRMAPPQEEHPLFRSQRTTPQSEAEEWKRDSGAPTASTITLRDEDAEDPVYQKFVHDLVDSLSRCSSTDQTINPPVTISIPITTNATKKTKKKQGVAQTTPPLKVSIPSRAQTPETAAVSPSESTPTQTPSRHSSFSRKLSLALGMKSADGSKKLRKKMPSSPTTDRAAAAQSQGQGQGVAPPPETGPLRGSPKSLKSPKATGTGPRQAMSPSSPVSPLSSHATAIKPFAPITTHIPDDSLWDDLGVLCFSNRGSIMFGAKTNNTLKALRMRADNNTTVTNVNDNDTMTGHKDEADATATAEKSRAAQQDAPSVPSICVSSLDVERESQKVRSLYESGDGLNWEDGGRVSFAERLEPTAEVPSEEEENSAVQVRREYELAGGIEDWEDLQGVDVDRYGFISPKRPMTSRPETAYTKTSMLSTRRRNVLTKRPSTSYSVSLPGGFIRPPSRKVSARSLNTYASDLSTTSLRSTRSSIRSATNHLPHNRDRRWMDEAGEMLSLQAGLTGISDDDKTGKQLEAQKRKEAERSEKWRRMATAVAKLPSSSSSLTTTQIQHQAQTSTTTLPQQPQAQGQGMSYTFDTTSPKLIERTWKGIPDCWRSAAWYSFLATSAAKHAHYHPPPPETEDYLIAEFHRLQAVASPDDVQIDLDVPRTVNGHIMFRRRYRGGQRLLFRVLHAISLYFPEVGYVQGMASLGATLLCYFEEERAFVMLVRLWRYRGLARLYRPGFEGLMAALREFEGRWLEGLGRMLRELAIDATAYGTRWYLTLFNLSIPFAAQLRVWDVFMLLGDSPPDHSPSIFSAITATTAPTTDPTADDNNKGKEKESANPQGLEVIHATSAALIHALRDVLLDSDFENAMKALTAWIPVRDEDLLMKVARAEWKRHCEGSGKTAGGLVGKLWEWEWEREWRLRKGEETKEKKELKEQKEKEKKEKKEKGKEKEKGQEKKEETQKEEEKKKA